MSYYDDASLVLIPSGVKTSKVYSQKPTDGTGDLTFSRASTATRTNESGVIESVASNVPRLDYRNADGTLNSCPRLLLEPQRTNLALQSENFSTTWTTNNLSVTTNVVTSPDGTLTADEIVSTTNSNANVGISQAITIVSGATYSASFYVKPNTQRYIFIGLTAVGAIQQYVTVVIDTDDFTVGQTAVGTTSGTLVSTNIEAASNGFYRVTLTASINRTDGRIRIGFANAKTGNFIGTTGDVAVTGSLGNSLYLWGAQLEAGAYPTTYIPTTTAAVTRLADAASKTGISSLIGQTEGVIFLDFVFKTPATTTGGQISITDSSAPFDRVLIWNNFTLNTLAVNLQVNGANIFNTSLGTFVDGQRYKIAIAYKSGSNAAYVNGTQIFTDTNTFTFASTMTGIFLGAYEAAGMAPHQLLNQAALFPTRLTDAQLAEITTL